MLIPKKSEDRGNANHGWLNAYHSFSFADYYDPNNMGFSVLRVINEDRIAGGTGFSTHGHADMEIVTYITEGALQHKDTLGNTAIIRPGEIQTMSAGTGIKHSEVNAQKDAQTHLLQIWILPNKKGHAPGYGQKSFLDKIQKQNFVLLVSGDGHDDSIQIHQDVKIYVGKFTKEQELTYTFEKSRSGWVQTVKGKFKIGEHVLEAGDGIAIVDEKTIDITAMDDETEFLFFDLPQH